jgi:aspartate/methionine/tyrosine aminotransferase
MFSDRTNWVLTQNRFTQAVEQARARGAQLLDLTASNPTRVGLKYDAAKILNSLNSDRALDYDPRAKGLLNARQAVADYYRTDHGLRALDPERIILTASTSEGYSYVFRLLCNAGDELLVPKPSYPLFEFLADLQDVKLVPYPLIYDHGWQMDFHSLEKAVTSRTRGVVLVHPNNPTGSYVHTSELEHLNEFCESHRLALIVDEVFLDYVFDPTEHVGTAAHPQLAPSFVFNDKVLTFTLSGLSKISALPQMKVAWVITSGPAEQIEPAIARLEVIADTYLSMNAPVQWAVPTMLDQRRNIQPQLMERVRNNLVELDRQLATQKSSQRLHLEGGWYAVLRIPVTRSDEDLAIELIREKSLLVHPGHFYDFESDGYLILSLIPQAREFAEGCQRMLRYLNS